MPQSQATSCLTCCPRRSNSSNRHSTKKGSRNFVAAGFSLLVLVLLTSSLTEPNWFFLEGGGCTQNYIGITHFFFSFQRPHYVYNEKLQTGVIDKCITADILVTLQTCLVLVSFAIFFTVFQIVLDLVGPGSPVFKAIQVNAVCNTVSVLVCVTITGLCYWAGRLLRTVQEATRIKPGQRLTITFSVGFYLIVAAGAVSLIAAAANCFRQPLALLRLDRERRRTLTILADQHQASVVGQNHEDDDDDVLLIPPPSPPCRRPLPPTPAPPTQLPPPPDYTP